MSTADIFFYEQNANQKMLIKYSTALWAIMHLIPLNVCQNFAYYYVLSISDYIWYNKIRITS